MAIAHLQIPRATPPMQKIYPIKVKRRAGFQLHLYLVGLLLFKDAINAIMKKVSTMAKLMQTFNKGALEFSFAYSGVHDGGLIAFSSLREEGIALGVEMHIRVMSPTHRAEGILG
jgi:hypothetical protein